jgi:hypothetical protein
MNSKKVKALRKLVRNLQQSQGEIPVHGFVTVKNTSKHIMVKVPVEPAPELTLDQSEEFKAGQLAGTITVTDKKEPAQRVEKITLFDGQRCVAPRSQRAVYLHLKSELKKVDQARKK